MKFWCYVMIGSLAFCLMACGEDTPERTTSPSSTAEKAEKTAASDASTQTGTVSGGVSARILPENPTSKGCLRVMIDGIPGNNQIVWSVNGSQVSAGTRPELCSEYYSRDDTVSVRVGTHDQGGTASVTIANSPPKVVDISSSPGEVFAGVDVTVSPVAEDADDDMVDFTYLWVINGEPRDDLTEPTLPGDTFTKGDTIQVRITPNDFFMDGQVYESYAMPVPNAPPRIISQPPQEISSLDYQYQVEVNDPDDNSFTFRLDEAPEGMTIDEQTGLIQWSLVEARPGSHTIAIIATDADGAESAQEYTLTLSPGQ